MVFSQQKQTNICGGICSTNVCPMEFEQNLCNFMLDCFIQRGQNMSLICCEGGEKIFWHNTSWGKWTKLDQSCFFRKGRKKSKNLFPYHFIHLAALPIRQVCLVKVWILVGGNFSWRCFAEEGPLWTLKTLNMCHLHCFPPENITHFTLQTVFILHKIVFLGHQHGQCYRCNAKWLQSEV